MKPELSEVLKIVNEVRVKALDVYPLKELPRGKPCRVKTCPLAIALHTYVDEGFLMYDSEDIAESVAKVLNTNTENIGTDWFVNSIPQILTDFVRAFDVEQYPELIEKEEK